MKKILFLLVLLSGTIAYSQNCTQIYNSVTPSYTAFTKCVGSSTQFSAYSNTGVLGLTYKWENESHTVLSNLSALNYTFTQSGADTIFLVANYPGCPAYTLPPLVYYIYENPENILNLGPDVSMCEGETVSFNASVAGTSNTYNWNTGATTSSITVSTSGDYKVTVSNQCGVGHDTVRVTIKPDPIVNLGPDREVCAGTPVVLDAGTTNATYLWSTGETTQTISVLSRNVSISVSVDSTGCIGGDTITISDCPIDVQLPSAFSPNGDGKNDKLFVRGNNISEIDLKIFNRLSTMVYHGTSISEGWDGTYQGKIQECDVYVYILTGKTLNGTKIEKSGSIALIK